MAERHDASPESRVDDPGHSPGRMFEHGGLEAAELLVSDRTPEEQPAPSLLVGGLRGKGAVVTGGATGIGRAIALELARSGASVAFNYITEGPWDLPESAHQVRKELEAEGVRVFARACDVRDPVAVEKFVEDAHEALGGLHILVNNAGISRDRALWRLPSEDWAAVVSTNLDGAFHFTRAIAPHFRAQEHGKIVNVASVHALRPEFGIAAYAASKAGLIGLTRSAAVELGPRNINVNAVAPGYIRTTKLTEGVPAEILDRARERSALHRLGDPHDVACVVLFLCSEAARHITGAVIPVDGGYLL